MDESRPIRAFRVTGRVQGVGYRWWTKTVADELGVRGLVRNRRDGSVEVVAIGVPEQVAELVARLTVGPRFARVDRVEELEAPAARGADSFEIER